MVEQMLLFISKQTFNSKFFNLIQVKVISLKNATVFELNQNIGI
jgi:hypothetical protein